jgi:hypothetical protein
MVGYSQGAAAPVSSVGKVVCVLTPPTHATPIYADRERCIAALANWKKLAKLYADRKTPKTCARPCDRGDHQPSDPFRPPAGNASLANWVFLAPMLGALRHAVPPPRGRARRGTRDFGNDAQRGTGLGGSRGTAPRLWGWSRPHAVQLAGCEARWMARGALGPDHRHQLGLPGPAGN